MERSSDVGNFAMDLDLAVGQKFFRYEDVESAVRKFEGKNCVNLYKKDSRTINAAQKKCPKKAFSSDLKYADLAFACVHNGKYRSHVTTGERPNQSTIRTGCPFVIKLRSYDRQCLTVSHIGPEHNHECDRDSFQHHPSQRKLQQHEVDEVQNMIKLQANKKLIRQHVQEKTNKVILLKDIHNCARNLKKNNPITSEMEDLKTHLQSAYPDLSMQVTHTDNEVTGIFFQDSQMKDTFEKYPEVIVVDSTYKLNLNRMPLYAMLVIDGNLQSHCVSFFLVTSEDNSTIRDMVQIFKTNNPNWTKTETIITDKDFGERAVFKAEMPGVKLQICLFHVLRTFSREVTTAKANITPEERTRLLELLEKITYASDESEYDRLHKELQVFGGTVQRYFDTNWHTIKEEWVQAFKQRTFTFGTNTTNRIESFFQKLKSVITSKTTLKDMISKLMGLIETLRKERFHRQIIGTIKVPTVQITDEDDRSYHSLLTLEAYKLVHAELQKVPTVTIVSATLVESNYRHFQVTDNTCRLRATFTSHDDYHVGTSWPCKKALENQLMFLRQLITDGQKSTTTCDPSKPLQVDHFTHQHRRKNSDRSTLTKNTEKPI